MTTTTAAPFTGTCVKCHRDDKYLTWRNTRRGEAKIAACVDGNACSQAAWARRDKARRDAAVAAAAASVAELPA